MKQNLQLGMKSSPAPYVAPQIAVSRVTVERGFAESSFDFNGSEIQAFEQSNRVWSWGYLNLMQRT